MESLGACYIDFEQYPQNLPNQDVSVRRLESYRVQFGEEAGRLFDEDEARLSFWDLNKDANDFELIRAQSLDEVRGLCLLGSSQHSHEAFHALDCRFIFLYSYNTRSPLFTTREMLTLALSYHTVNPWFLDFLFPFGDQDEPVDSRFSSFRSKVYQEPQLNLNVPRLDRTGHELHLCYNLRAAETTRNKYMPWSVRQTALYHSFDLMSGQAFFIVLKGNDSMSKDLRRETRTHQWRGTSDQKVSNAYISTLKTHLSVCWWSCDNWRRYINHLEQRMNDLTSQAIHEKVRQRPVVRRETKPKVMSKSKWYDRFSHLKRKGDMQDVPEIYNSTYGHGQKPPLDAEKGHNMSSTTTKVEDSCDPFAEDPYNEIEFPDLQRAQLVEEKANEAIYAVKSNIKIIKALREFYLSLAHMSTVMQQGYSWFSSQLEPILYDLEMHQSSLETLSHLFNERKNLMLGILEFQNMQASKYFAEKAQISADTMERMTDEMRDLTRKTKDETVSMTVIAGVTMFFLPGTFVSTLMSTDIVQWEYVNGHFELQAAPGARNLFIALTIPLMCLSFAVWAFVGWRSRRQPSEG